MRPLQVVTAVAFASLTCFAAPQSSTITKGTDAMSTVPGTVVIDAGSPLRSTFVADHFDSLHLTKVKSKLRVRSFAELGGRQPSLLCTKTKPKTAYTATYEFSAGSLREGALWVFEQGRAWASPFSWRIDEGEWRKASSQLWMQQGQDFEKGPTFAWVRLGDLALDSGKHTLEVSVTEPKENGVYLLSQGRFVILPRQPLAGDYTENYPFTVGENDPEKPSRRAIHLWNDLPPAMAVDDGFRPWIEPYLIATDKPLGAVLVIPGGAYRVRAPYEGTPVAKRLNQGGFHAFVLQYRVAPHSRAEALADGQQAIRVIRTNASAWKVALDRIAVCGFSAGAHLSGSLGRHVLKADSSAAEPAARFSSRPDAVILGYPPAYGTFDVDSGLPATFPPTFVWHTVEDAQVSVDNSIRIAQALRKSKTPFEMHLYPRGPHGMALAAADPHVASWMTMCCLWLDELGWKK